MQNISIERTDKLPPALVLAVEQLLGRPVAADEEVSIAAIPRRQRPLSEDRADVAQRLAAYLNRRAEKVGDIADDEIDAALDEAVGHARHARM